MSLEVRNTLSLLDPDKLKLKVLIYGLSGTGKTTWAASAPNPGFIACETGHGNGLLSVADKGVAFVNPSSTTEFETSLGAKMFTDKDTVVLDSISDAYKSFIKDYALSIPRRQGDSDKRRAGVPEIDDYGTMGELCRRLLRKFLDQHPTQHVIVTATEKFQEMDLEKGRAESLYGPDLPGAMFTGSTAMFDLVLRMRVRQVLSNPKDAKSRTIERYFMTANDGKGTLAKARLNVKNVPLLEPEESGDFPTILARVQEKLRGLIQETPKETLVQ